MNAKSSRCGGGGAGGGSVELRLMDLARRLEGRPRPWVGADPIGCGGCDVMLWRAVEDADGREGAEL
eukprot:5747927-Alexandrium_andersonii.AAC.1